MPPSRRLAACAAACLLSLVVAETAFAGGAILHKSGPIQITEDGAFVWLVNPDHDSVSRIRTSDPAVAQFPLPNVGRRHRPTGLALTPSGAEVWVAAQDSDRVYVLNAATGAITHTFDLPAGTGPATVAISADGVTALVALHRSAEIAAFNVTTHALRTVITGLFRRPFGIAFTTNPNQAWVTHTVMDGEDSFASAIDTSTDTVAAQVVFKSVNPKTRSQVSGDATPIPEGGYLFFRGHLAQLPGTNHLWLPTQYQNFHNDAFTPDSTLQSAIHKVDLATATHLNADRVVLSAVYAHQNTTLVGNGWNAKISGGVNLAFTADGSTAYLVGSHSNDVLVFPTNIGLSKPAGAPALTEVSVGDLPIGIALSPTANRAYVLNHLSRDVSVIDTAGNTELRRIPSTPGAAEPLPADILRGARLFNSSTDTRLSSNAKVSCASCHPNGESDGITWGFAQFGAGNRKTPSLVGLVDSFGPRVNNRGQLHRSGDRDEVQDFDLTARLPIMGGTGFLTAPNPALGAPNAGLDTDLDALSAYLLSLSARDRSPHRAADGALTPAAKRGAIIFKHTAAGPYSVGCISCHTPPRFTDLGFHDVGGQRIPPENEGPLFNTPSLIGAWDHSPFTQAVGNYNDSVTIGGVVRNARRGVHGNTSGLSRRQLADLETFVNSIDGDLARSGIDPVNDTDPPRILAVLPVSLDAVEVIFDETVQPVSASNPANYRFTDGSRDYAATAAVVNAAEGNRVRVAVALDYPGCPVTYTLLPGPIQDLAGAIRGGANNALDVSDASNRKSFTLDGSITVTFGDTGLHTFTNAARNAGFNAGLGNVSYARWWLYPYTSPAMKGFVSFDFVATLTTTCGITNANDILDARFTVLPEQGHRNTVQLRRCLMPWGEPPNDWCFGCTGSVTLQHSTYASIPWHQTGARALGGSGTSVNEYYPIGAYDLAATIDATAQVAGINQRLEFSGNSVTEAFRFWLGHPNQNYGYAAEITGSAQTGTEFWGSQRTQEDGRYGTVLSITFAIHPRHHEPDCNTNGLADTCEYAAGCPGLTPADLNCDGHVDARDIPPFVSVLLRGGYLCQADIDQNGQVAAQDMPLFIRRLLLP